MTEQRLVLVRGHSGSGKSTFAATFKGFVAIAADDYFTDGEEYHFDPSNLGCAHKYCFDKTEEALAQGLDVVVHNTFTRHWEMKNYLYLAEVYNVELEVYRCTGNYQNVHGVPESIVSKQRSRMQDYEGEIYV